MDNGLIFPYRRRTDNVEPCDAKRLKRRLNLFGGRGGVERGTRAGSRPAMECRRKVASAWRWLSTSKDVGRGVGKSAPHISLRPDGDRNCGKQGDPMLPRKPSSEVRAARTPNRLRWIGREYQGDRVNHG